MAIILQNICRRTISKMVMTNVQILSRRTITTFIPMDVQIISKETIKPSPATPNHLRTHKLSLFDQILSNIYVPLVFFYSSNNQDSRKTSDFLKKSLAETLKHYYPFAGRIRDSFSVDCNDHGISFTEAHIGMEIAEILQQPNIELQIRHLLPRSPQLKLEISQRELLAVQVNYFSGGEIAIAISFWHGIADGSAIANFMRTWAAIACGENDNIKNVVLDCSSMFPPQNFPDSSMDNYINQHLLSMIVTKRLVFDHEKIAELKDKINNELVNKFQLHATNFVVVVALIWGAAIAVARETNRPIKSHMTVYPMNLRHRMNPPLPFQCIGNVFRLVKAEWEMENGVDLIALARQLVKAKELVNEMKEHHRQIKYLDFIKQMNGAGSESRLFSFTSVRGLPFYEANFGWGKPVWFTAGAVVFHDFAALSDASDGKGIEAWVGLLKEDMEIFEQNPGIMTYASSNPSICIE